VQLIDISLKGVLVEKPASQSVEQGDEFRLRLPLTSTDDKNIQMELKVAHVEEDKVGFTWESIDAKSFTHLQRLITYNLGDAREVERELETLFAEN